MNAYDVLITYTVPTEALITVLADSEVNAREIVQEKLADWPGLEVHDIRKVAESDYTAEDLDPKKTVN
jgi:hypothetical protein